MVPPQGNFHFFLNQLRGSCSTGRASESWELGEPQSQRGGPQSQLGGLQSQPGGPQSQPGGPWIPLGRPLSKLGEPLRKLQRWEGLGSSWVSLGASWEGLRACWKTLGRDGRWGTNGKKKKKMIKISKKISLWGRCPKKHYRQRVL